MMGQSPRRVMLVTNKLQPSPKGGRALLCNLNHHALRAIFGAGLHVFELPTTRARGLAGLLNIFRLHIDGLDKPVTDAILRVIQEQACGEVFIDGSNLGALATAIKRRFPHVRVTTFFHNVEARFFLGALRLRKSLRAAGVLWVNYLAERQAVRWSDRRICLSERDSRLLGRLYGKGATHVSAMALVDRMPAELEADRIADDEAFALFVGGTFYANVQGIEWYVKNVAPVADIKVLVVGRGFESLRQGLERPGKLEVVGEVDDVSVWYRRARFVIAPIFDGSGMKTKVAEALMYGKRVVGTPEAFSGYESILPRAGWLCESAGDFANSMAVAKEVCTPGCDPDLRRLYVENYSLPAAERRLRSIMESQPSIGEDLAQLP